MKIIPSGAKEFRNQRAIPNTNNNFLIDRNVQDNLRSMNQVSVQCKVGAVFSGLTLVVGSRCTNDTWNSLKYYILSNI